MTAADTFVKRAAVQSILQGLESRFTNRLRGNAPWDENVQNILPAAQRFYELLLPVAAGIESEADRQQLIRGAWQEFRKLAIALSPPKEKLPPCRRDALETDWTWIAYDNRDKAIRVDPVTGQPTKVSQKAMGSPDLDVTKLAQARTRETARKRRWRKVSESAGQSAGHFGASDTE